MNLPTKAITLHRPWAHAVAHMGKDIENRSWNCPLRVGDLLAIHAGKKWDKEAATWIESKGLGTVPPEAEHPQGIVAIATFQGNVTQSDSPWFSGDIGWQLGNVRALPQPIECKGQQGIWTPTRATVEAIEAQLNPSSNLPDWIANRPKTEPLIGYHSLNRGLTEIQHPQTKIVRREDGRLCLFHTVIGSVEALDGYRKATPADLATATTYTSADGQIYGLAYEGGSVVLLRAGKAFRVRLLDAETVSLDAAVRSFARAFDGVIVPDEEVAA